MQKLRLAIVAKSAWRDLPQRVSALSKFLSSKLPATVEISLVLRDYGAIPADRNGRITAAFLDKTLAVDGLDGACLLVSLADREKYKLKPTLRGHYLADDDGYFEFWVAADRTTKRRGKPQLEETFTHELCHGLYRWLGLPDRTHEHHDAGSLAPALAEISAAWPKPKPTSAAFQVPKNPLAGVDAGLADVIRRTVRTMAGLGKPVFVFEGFRTRERQAALYAQGRTAPGSIVTNAKPGESLHEKGKAVDVVFEKTLWSNPPEDWALLGMLAKAFGKELGVPVTWGGDWRMKDFPHFEV